jgi:pimeloyl-ACP methyl ester carboxylesterase
MGSRPVEAVVGQPKVLESRPVETVVGRPKVLESRLVETAGGRTKVRVHEGGSGPPLLFLSGVSGLFPDDPFLAALAARHRVAAPLLPGYEDSEGAENLRTMQDVVLWAFDLLDAIGMERPLVLGHSMGGMIAAEMAALCPREVEKLVLVAPAGLWLDAHPIPDLFALMPFELPSLLFHDAALGARLLTSGLVPEEMRDASGQGASDFAALAQRFDDTRFLQAFLIQNARRLGMAGKLLFPIPDRGLSERLYRVRARTTLVWGASDRLIDVAYASAWQRLLPEARLVHVPDAGHMLPYEKPDALLEAIG